MSRGVSLTLFVGPVVAVPAPRAVLEALTAVEVTTASGEASGFKLTFKLSTRSPLHTIFLLAGGGTLPPILRVIVVATVNGTPDVLVDGVVKRTQVTPGTNARHATLDVYGYDLTTVMNIIPFDGFPYPGMPAEARVAVICAKYALFGMVPLVIPSPLIDVPVPVERIPRHQGTDLAYVRQLADEVGYVFYLDAGPQPGMNTAYWGPELKVGVPQPALNMDMDAATNVESISFAFEPDAKELPIVFIQNPQTKVPIPIPVPDITPFSPPLGLLSPTATRPKPIEGTAKYGPLRGALIGMAKAVQTADVVTATGTLDVLRYGRSLKARRLVGVRGGGHAYDGLYYVKSVTHSLKAGEYKQQFALGRNGLLSTVPRVPA